MNTTQIRTFTATRNACKLCTPLGAALAFEGIEQSVPVLHGSQGCATYIRRYLISHFKEPVDIASTNFSEETAIFGGGANLKQALDNIRRQYRPQMIGIATTCLSETIGDDVPMFLKSYRDEHPDDDLPRIVHVATPSYNGTHTDGFHQAVKATVASFLDQKDPAPKKGASHLLNLFPGLVSPEDLRHLKEILVQFGIEGALLPDYSERLDGTPWSEFEPIQSGGTRLGDIAAMKHAHATIEFGRVLACQKSAGTLLADRCDIPLHRLGLPIGVNESDRFFSALEAISGQKIPESIKKKRGRLIDAYVDGHKYVSQVRAVVYGEEDLVIGLTSFLCEIGIKPVLCASGGKSKFFSYALKQAVPEIDALQTEIREGVDFVEIEEVAKGLCPEILIGNSKGYALARRMQIPLVRVGFPIHDRIGGGRLLHLGYRGAQQLFDRIVNALLEKKQESSDVGYFYI